MNISKKGETIDGKIASVKRSLAPLLAFSVVINLLTLVLPIYMLQIYDRVLTSRNLTTLLLLTIVAFAFLAVGSLLTHYRSRMSARLGLQLSQRLEQPVYGALLKQSVEAKPVQKQLIGDLDSIREFIGEGSMVRLFDIPWTPLFLLVIFIVHPLAGAVASAFALALLLIDWLGDRQTGVQNDVYRETKASADQLLNTSLRRADELWSMGMADGVGAQWHRRRARALAEQTIVSDSRSSYQGYRRFIQQGAQMAMLGVGAFLAVQEQITPGSIVAGSIICARALVPIAGITRSWRSYKGVRRAIADMKQTMAEDSVRTKHQISLATNLELVAQNLSIDPGDGVQPAIRNLDFTLHAGQSLAVVGPGSTGKSLLVKTLIGGRRPVSGSVKINGVDIHHLAGHQLGRMIGYVPEQISLLDGTFGQNIARFGQATVEDLDRALDRAGLLNCLPLLPDGYNTPITVAAKHLSALHFRFAALARALYGDPALLVLDRVDDGLDESALDLLINIVRQSQSFGQIVVLVTNRASIVQQLDRVMVLTKRGVETFCDVQQLPNVAQIS